MVKRSYRPEWGDDWRSHFSVAAIDGRQGNSLRLDGGKITVNMLRVGYNTDGSWRLFSLRHDFSPAVKVQTQDDITASTVVPGVQLGLDPGAVVQARGELREPAVPAPRRRDPPGLRQAGRARHRHPRHVPVQLRAADPGRRRRDARRRRGLQRLHRADGAADQPASPTSPEGSGPDVLRAARPTRGSWTASRRRTRATCSSAPTAPTPRATAVADLSARLVRRLPSAAPLLLPVDVVAAGRRNNPPDGSVPPLCSYSPLHYMELPELFMEFISSMTGKSPSTTGAGSEGALTKGPFNAHAGRHRPERRPAVLRSHRLRRLGVRRRVRRAARAGRPRHLPAGAGAVLADDPAASGTPATSSPRAPWRGSTDFEHDGGRVLPAGWATG